jgi:hypothetical protein
MRVFPGENHGNLERVTIVFSGMHESPHHIRWLHKGAHVGPPVAEQWRNVGHELGIAFHRSSPVAYITVVA